MKRVLVITYYWPPTGGSGVQRWLKFCKYLREFGWEPIVYTPEDPDVDLLDATLARDVHPAQTVIKLPIREPRRIYRRFLGGSDAGGGSMDHLLYVDPAERTFKQNALVWARSNLLIPDARALWIEPSIEFLTEYLSVQPVDAIVSSGPPHSMHLIAKGVKEKLDIPWIADFRDPWTDIVYYDRMPLTKWADKKQHKLEQSVIDGADMLVEAAPSWAQRLRVTGAARVETVTNGYDGDDIPAPRVLSTEKFRINHSGVLTADRNHEAFWEALRAVGKGVLGFQSKVELEFVGRTDPSVFAMANRYGFGPNVVNAGYVTHAEAVDRMASAHVLLLPVNRTMHGAGFIPGKIFEYMATGRPILMIGPPEGDAARIIQETKTGVVFSYDDYLNLKTVLSEWFERFKDDTLKFETTDIERYSRRNLTRKMANLLDEVIGEVPPPGPPASDPSERKAQSGDPGDATQPTA